MEVNVGTVVLKRVHVLWVFTLIMLTYLLSSWL